MSRKVQNEEDRRKILKARVFALHSALIALRFPLAPHPPI